MVYNLPGNNDIPILDSPLPVIIGINAWGCDAVQTIIPKLTNFSSGLSNENIYYFLDDHFMKFNIEILDDYVIP